MTFAAFVLVLLSAALHAGWNYLGKRGEPSAAFFWIANAAGLVLLAPVALVHVGVLSDLPLELWVLVAATGCFLALYYAALGASYRDGEMSVVYPLARSSPVIVVLVTTLLLGRSEQIGLACAAGAFLVVAGCFLVPLDGWRGIRWSDYLCPSCALAFVAACGTAGYSLVDDAALRLLRILPDWDATTVERTLFYAALQAASCAFFLGIFVAARADERRRLRQTWRRGARGTALTTGVTIIATYSLVLWAMSFSRDVSYVVAFRQVSIPIGVALGAWRLGETVSRPRLVGLALVLTGLALVALPAP